MTPKIPYSNTVRGFFHKNILILLYYIILSFLGKIISLSSCVFMKIPLTFLPIIALLVNVVLAVLYTYHRGIAKMPNAQVIGIFTLLVLLTVWNGFMYKNHFPLNIHSVTKGDIFFGLMIGLCASIGTFAMQYYFHNHGVQIYATSIASFETILTIIVFYVYVFIFPSVAENQVGIAINAKQCLCALLTLIGIIGFIMNESK